MNRWTAAAALGLFVKTVLCTACHSTSKTLPANSVLQLLEDVPATGAARPAESWNAVSAVLIYDIVGDEGTFKGQATITRSPTDRFGAEYVDVEVARSESFWRSDEHGNIVITAHIDHKENALTTFDPPLTLWPVELLPGQPFKGESAMRVVDSRNPKKLKEVGTVNRTVTYVGDQQIRTPLGEFVAQRLESRVIADLRMADADEHVVRFIVPGVGVVAEQTVEEVKILGALSTTKRRTLILHH